MSPGPAAGLSLRILAEQAALGHQGVGAHGGQQYGVVKTQVALLGAERARERVDATDHGVGPKVDLIPITLSKQMGEAAQAAPGVAAS